MPSSTLQQRLQQGGTSIGALKGSFQSTIAPKVANNAGKKTAAQNFSFLRTVGNIPSSAGELGKNIFEVIRHPIQTTLALGQVGAGAIQSAPGVNKFFDRFSQNKDILEENRETFRLMKDFFVERYGGADKILNTIENDPVGFSLDLSVVFSGAGGILRSTGSFTKATPIVKAGEIATRIGQAAEPITGAFRATKFLLTKPKGGLAGLAGFTGKASLGISTGAGPTNISIAARANPTKDFVEALRNNFVRDDLVQAARAAFENMKFKRASEYQVELSKIERMKESFDLAPIRGFVLERMASFKIRVGPKGQLDFSGSPIAKAASQKEVSLAIKDVLRWRETSPSGIDTLKRRLGDFYTESSQGRALVAAVKNEVATLLKREVPGYEQMTAKYEKATKDLREIERTMSLGTKSSMDQSLKKLTSSLRENQDLRGELLDMLNQASKSDLEGMVAGAALNPSIPSSLVGRGIFASGPLTVMTGIAVLSPKILLPMLVASPRIVGEFLLAIGYTRGYVNRMLSFLSRLKATERGRTIEQILFEAGRTQRELEE